jgi:hypothetical protein
MCIGATRPTRRGIRARSKAWLDHGSANAGQAPHLHVMALCWCEARVVMVGVNAVLLAKRLGEVDCVFLQEGAQSSESPNTQSHESVAPLRWSADADGMPARSSK